MKLAEGERIEQVERTRAKQAEMERRLAEEERRAAPDPKREPLGIPYSGPRSGTIAWKGVIRGVELITIDGNKASVGTVTGELPGVPVLINPVKSKVAIVRSPSPRDRFRSLTLRVTGNGQMRLVFHWSLP